MTARAFVPPDEDVRAHARGTLDRSFLVEAGAGTGKTSLIVERIVSLVESGVPLRSVVAITFTEKAAGELKMRVRQALESRRESPRARAALLELERASISTIHAWCASLLRAYPVEAGVDPLFQVLDDNASRTLFERAWESWIGRELDTPGAAVPIRGIRGFTAGWWMKQLELLARFLIAHRGRLPQALPAPLGGDPTAVLAEVVARVDLRGFIEACPDPDDLLVRELRRIEETLSAFKTKAPDEQVAELFGQMSFSGSKKKLGNKTKWRGGPLEEARAAMFELVDAWKDARARAQHDLCARVIEWVAKGFVPVYEEEKRRIGALDFDDLLVRVAAMLREHRAVRGEIRRGVKALILDEFQDTDPIQCETAFLLTSILDVDDWRQARPKPGSLFLVGDPKQSIYAFRGADIETYSAAREAMESGDGLLRIQANFRSRSSVLDWVNGAFGRLIAKPEDGGRYQTEYSPLVATHDAGGPGAGVHVVRPPEGVEYERAAASRDAEARHVAALLRDRAHGRWGVRDRASGAERTADWGDMVVLLRNRTSSLPAYERAFRAADIPYVVVGGRALWERLEVRALAALCQAIENPFDAVSVVAALKSPFFGASDAELLLWKRSRGSFVARESDTSGAAGTDGDHEAHTGPVGEALRRIRTWHRDRLDVPPYRLLQRVLDETGAIVSFGLKPDGAQRVANLLRLVEAARDTGDAFGPRGAPPSFRAFARGLAERVREEREEAEGAILDESSNAVRLLTMHAAKGLEFPIVVLGDLAVQDNRGNALHVDPRTGGGTFAFRLGAKDKGLETYRYEEAKEAIDVRARAEDLRLLYVAATRACDALVIPLFATSKRAPGYFHRMLVETFPGLLQTPAGGEVEPGNGGPARVVDEELAPVEGDPPVFRIPLADIEQALEEPAPPAAADDAGGAAFRRGLDARRLARRVEPVTRVVAAGAEPQRLAATQPGLEADEARRVGICVHRAIELVEPGDEEALARAARDEARASRLGAEAIEHAVRLARNAARVPSLPRVVRSPRVLREWPFALPIGPLPGADGDAPAILEGVVDLAWVEHDDAGAAGLVVLDWKTDRPSPGAGPEQMAEHHWPQLLAYAWALGHITGLPVRRAVVALLAGPWEVERTVRDADLLAARDAIAGAFAADERIARRG